MRTTKKRVSTFVALVAGLALLAPLTAIPASASIPGNIPGTGVTGPPFYGPPLATGADPLGASWCVTGGGPAPNDVAGNKGDIPYYAIGCTLQSMHDDLPYGDRLDIKQIGVSYTGKPLYSVVVDVRETPEQIRDSNRNQQLRPLGLTDPAHAQELIDTWGGDVKITNHIEAAIHGNEPEGVDMIMELLYQLATTPHCDPVPEEGPDPCTTRYLDDIMDHMVLVTIPVVNPDGRQAGTRANGAGLDMNRDLFNQYNSEMKAVVEVMKEYQPVMIQGLHSAVNPTLVEGTTKPHNPGLDYDLLFKWERQRTLANKAALATRGYGVTIPMFDYNSSGGCRLGPAGTTTCNETTNKPNQGMNPDNSEGWDSWGPFYEGQYGQLMALDGGTIEMCGSQTSATAGCGNTGGSPTGRVGSILVQRLVNYSNIKLMIDNRHDMLWDQQEKYRRGVENEARPPWSNVTAIYPLGEAQHNWMVEFPTAFIIPLGAKQRSKAEADRLVDWCINQNIEVRKTKAPYTYNGVTYPTGSYIVPMTQALRGMAYTALSYGTDISNQITTLYATPAAWSHGQVWGADVLEVPRSEMGTFNPSVTQPITASSPALKPVKKGPGKFLALPISSAHAIMASNAVLNQGIPGRVADAPFTASTGKSLPAGSLIFKITDTNLKALKTAAKSNDVVYTRVKKAALPTGHTVGKTRIAVIGVTDATLALRTLGFEANTLTLANIASNPSLLDNYEVIYNGGGAPSAGAQGNAIGAFIARGGGYVGETANGAATFPNSANIAGGSLTGGGAAVSSQSALGIIGIWKTATGPGTGDESPILGGYPSWSDYGDNVFLPSNVVWMSNAGANSIVDARYRSDQTGQGTYTGDPNKIMGAGLWRNRTSAMADQAIFAHGTQAAGANAGARYATFAMNMFSRQDGERNWPAVGAGIYWTNQTVAGLPVIP